MLAWPLGWQILDQSGIFTSCDCSSAAGRSTAHGSRDSVSVERVDTPALTHEALLRLVEAPLVADGAEPWNPRGLHSRGLLLTVSSLRLDWGKTGVQSAGKTATCWKAARNHVPAFSFSSDSVSCGTSRKRLVIQTRHRFLIVTLPCPGTCQTALEWN